MITLTDSQLRLFRRHHRAAEMLPVMAALLFQSVRFPIADAALKGALELLEAGVSIEVQIDHAEALEENKRRTAAAELEPKK